MATLLAYYVFGASTRKPTADQGEELLDFDANRYCQSTESLLSRRSSIESENPTNDATDSVQPPTGTIVNDASFHEPDLPEPGPSKLSGEQGITEDLFTSEVPISDFTLLDKFQ